MLTALSYILAAGNDQRSFSAPKWKLSAPLSKRAKTKVRGLPNRVVRQTADFVDYRVSVFLLVFAR